MEAPEPVVAAPPELTPECRVSPELLVEENFESRAQNAPQGRAANHTLFYAHMVVGTRRLTCVHVHLVVAAMRFPEHLALSIVFGKFG